MSDWMDRAACTTVDPELFFDRDQTAEALAVCQRCEVRSQCLDRAISNREADGVWGGMTERQRAAHARRRGFRWPTVETFCRQRGCQTRTHNGAEWCHLHVPKVPVPPRPSRTFDRDAAAAVLREVADEHGVPVETIWSSRRDLGAVEVRQAAAVRLRGLGLSYSQIGGLLGRDHTSVMNLVRRAQVAA